MLNALFEPGSVAIIGASTKELSIGNRIVRNLQDFGYKGAIYPVNPRADEVRGIRAYGNIKDIPGEVDLAHIVIPNKYVPMALDDCGKKNVKFVIVNSAGFKEIGGKGAELEREVVRKAEEHGIRVFGPNCQGIINTDPDVRAYCNFTFTKPGTGGISVVAQSGGVGEVINQRFSELGAGVRMYASNGNACDISIPEIMEYWGEDDGTRVIVLYVEGLSDPRKFLEVAEEVASRKPVLGMKAGRTPEGAKAASSHTGGLAREEIATELIFKKSGILTFRDEEEMCQAAVAFASQPIPGGNRVGMITNTGGPAIIGTDELIDGGLVIPPLSDGAKERLREGLHPAASVNNPIDVLATANADNFRVALDVLADEPGIDSLYVNFVTPFFVDTESIAGEIARAGEKGEKPLVCNLMTDKRQWKETMDILKDGGVPLYSFPETAARALISLTRYSELQERDTGRPKVFRDVDRERATGIIREAKGEGGGGDEEQYLGAAEVYGLLEAYGIPVAPWRVVRGAAGVAEAAKSIGYPAAIKADAKDIVHKSDAGAVALDLKNAGEVTSAAEAMEERLSGSSAGFLVQRYVPGGRELIMGAKKEGNAGHLIVFGLGGIYTELLKDVSFNMAPVTECEAEEMLRSLRTYPLLEGFRGDSGVNGELLVEALLRLSQLVTEQPEILEMDLNPVMGFEDEILVVDARIRI